MDHPLTHQQSSPYETQSFFHRQPPPQTLPPLNAVVRLIAQLGGFLARKGDGDPGAKTLWLGMRDIAVFVQGLRFARGAL